MIRCEQKGPHQQVRFGLCLSVLPTAPGITLPQPVLPTHSPHPERGPQPRARGVDHPAGGEAGATTPGPQHSLQHPAAGCHLPSRGLPGAAPGRDPQHPHPATSPPTFSPGPSRSLKTLTRIRRPALGTPNHNIHSHGERLPAPWGLPEWGRGLGGGEVGFQVHLGFFSQWRAGHYCSFLLPRTRSSSPWSGNCEVTLWMSQPEGDTLGVQGRQPPPALPGPTGGKQSPAPCPGTTTGSQSAGKALLLPEPLAA